MYVRIYNIHIIYHIYILHRGPYSSTFHLSFCIIWTCRPPGEKVPLVQLILNVCCLKGIELDGWVPWHRQTGDVYQVFLVGPLTVVCLRVFWGGMKFPTYLQLGGKFLKINHYNYGLRIQKKNIVTTVTWICLFKGKWWGKTP